MNSTKPFNSGLGKWMRKAARPSGGVDSLNPRRWRGERLHHHGGGVCWLFVLLWMDSWCHELIVCKIWYKNNLNMRLTALLFDPPMRAPYRLHQKSSAKSWNWKRTRYWVHYQGPMNILLLESKCNVCQKHGCTRTTYYLGVPKVWEHRTRNLIPVQLRKVQRN